MIATFSGFLKYVDVVAYLWHQYYTEKNVLTNLVTQRATKVIVSMSVFD